MKATKKILCITLALVVAGLALIMPISASSADLPVIVVDGIGTTPLYHNFGTDDETVIFNEATIEAMIKDVIVGLVKGANADADYDKFADEFMHRRLCHLFVFLFSFVHFDHLFRFLFIIQCIFQKSRNFSKNP